MVEGGNYLCLPTNPQYTPGQYSDQVNDEGKVTEAEYYTSTSGLPIYQNYSGQKIPCAVCRRYLEGSKSLMIPGQQTCPSGFQPDFQGYLFAPPTSSSRGDYICMDSSPEGVGSSTYDAGSLLLSPVEAGQGSASLMYYTGGYELTCVHCGSIASGSVYTRWGRTTCPSDATAVYSGLMGGQIYSSNGGGLQYLCMSSSPQYAEATPGVQYPSSAVYTTEYYSSPADLSSTWNALQNYEAPCVVCQVGNGRGYSFMQPGRSSCPSGFNTDYS